MKIERDAKYVGDEEIVTCDIFWVLFVIYDKKRSIFSGCSGGFCTG